MTDSDEGYKEMPIHTEKKEEKVDPMGIHKKEERKDTHEPYREHKIHETRKTDEIPKTRTYEDKSEKKKSNSNMPKWLPAAAVIQILLLVFIAFQINGLEGNLLTGNVVAEPGVPTNQPSAAIPSVPTPAPAPIVDMEELIDDDDVKGNPDAPVTIVEFSDFECPFCARFYSQTLPSIDEQYIETGKVKLVFRDFPLGFHENAQKAAEAAECAGEQDKYWEMHDKLFEDGVSGGVVGFKQYASDLGLDTEKFDKCLDSGEMRGEIRKDSTDGQKAGISGTPGFIINGILIEGAQPFEVFQQVIEGELAS